MCKDVVLRFLNALLLVLLNSVNKQNPQFKPDNNPLHFGQEKKNTTGYSSNTKRGGKQRQRNSEGFVKNWKTSNITQPQTSNGFLLS